MTTGLGDGVTILRNVTTPPLGADNDGNGVLDDCERAVFRRGDWNQDGQFNLSDAISLVDYLFRGGAAPAAPREIPRARGAAPSDAPEETAPARARRARGRRRPRVARTASAADGRARPA